MAHTDHDSKPLMAASQEDAKGPFDHSSTLPEVVPAEHLKSNISSHNVPHYKQRYFDPSTPSSYSNYSPYTARMVSTPYTDLPQTTDTSTLSPRKLNRMKRLKFALIIAFGTFVFTAVVIGAALGIPLVTTLRRLSPTDYSPLDPTTVISLQKGNFCTSEGKSAGTSSESYTSRDGKATFDVKCGQIFQEGQAALNPLEPQIAQGTVRNIAVIVSYRVEDCLEACASLNTLEIQGNNKNPKCQSMTFIPALKGALDAVYAGNCFLKNSTMFNLAQSSVNVAAVSAEIHNLRST